MHHLVEQCLAYWLLLGTYVMGMHHLVPTVPGVLATYAMDMHDLVPTVPGLLGTYAMVCLTLSQVSGVLATTLSSSAWCTGYLCCGMHHFIEQCLAYWTPMLWVCITLSQQCLAYLGTYAMGMHHLIEQCLAYWTPMLWACITLSQ